MDFVVYNKFKFTEFDAYTYLMCDSIMYMSRFFYKIEQSKQEIYTQYKMNNT